MPWYNGDYPPSYKNQPIQIRDKATEVANEILKETGNEDIAIATGLKKSREYFKEHPEEAEKMLTGEMNRLIKGYWESYAFKENRNYKLIER